VRRHSIQVEINRKLYMNEKTLAIGGYVADLLTIGPTT
jgi:N-formylglutamate amidohydrolase